ncbi:ESX secretion-associated protein EspG [Nocardia sp. NBC_01329]|uniref:ESX secretion-associated protein EspG n=1 Tax=Nocardia sp. NBC_01329 TaxID=2903594 RepID=UPI002E13A3A8|nr:ESX secretion-associated protein EspG [Nocardia sp. NBC_01329]
MAEWVWEPDDFAALWYSDAYDRFPTPLRYTSRFAFNDEARAHRLTVRDRYSREERAGIQVALDTLGTSEMRIEILGSTCAHKRSTGRDDRRQYRIVGARTEAYAVMLSQVGAEGDYGPIQVRLFRPENLAARLVSGLAPCTPGTGEAATFHPGDLEPRQEAHFEDHRRARAREEYRKLIGREKDGSGCAVLLMGRFDAATEPARVLRWHDIAGDGRYTEQRGNHVTVRPATSAEFTRHFGTWLDNAWRRLEEERADAAW